MAYYMISFVIYTILLNRIDQSYNRLDKSKDKIKNDKSNEK